MESIDVHDLPEDQAQLVAGFVEFLRRRRQHQPQAAAAQRAPAPGESPFAIWPLGVKGTLSREDIYDYL
jgi:hypothetical protein